MAATSNISRTTDAAEITMLGRRSAIARREITRWRDDLRAETVTIGEILDARPACLSNVIVANLLTLIPGMGTRRLAEVNHRAISEHVNLLATVGDIAPREAEWVTATIDGGGWKTVSRGQCSCETAQDLADTIEQLSTAIVEHHQMVSDPELPAETFARADGVLYRAHQRAMGRRYPVDRAGGYRARDERVNARPFAQWLADQLAQITAAPDAPSAPLMVLASRVGMSERQLRRVMQADRISLRVVDSALTRFGAPTVIDDLYPLKEVA